MAIAMQRSSVKVIEEVSHVSPPPGSVPTTTLPLTFFDIMHIGSSRSAYKCLFFYETQISTLQFMQTTLPNLKTSLSLTLQHFFPLAGNLVFPPPPQTPYIFYTQGDSVSFVVKESTAEFNHLVGDHARHFHDFEDLVPELPPDATTASGCMKKMPIMTIQVTVFPNRGISLGIAFCHTAADGNTVAHFIRSWQSIHKSQGDLTCLENKNLPCFSRDLIKDPLGLATIFMKNKWQLRRSTNINVIPIHKFRVTYNIKHYQVKLLKDWVRKKWMEENRAGPLWMSTLVVTCAYLWVSLTKLQESNGTQHLSSSDSHFVFPVDCRDLLKIPATYFGNCLTLRFTSAKKSELLGENGILVAATAIGSEVMNFVQAPLKGTETNSFIKNFDLFKLGKDVIVLTGSPKFGAYKTDFGFGRSRKFEIANFDSSVTISFVSITDSREEEGGVQFGLAFALNESDHFNTIFYRGLSTMAEIYEKSQTGKEKIISNSKI